MDAVSLLYYAVVCAVLAGTVPAGARFLVRFAIGAGVGIAAALLLPLIRGWVEPAAAAYMF